MTDEDVPRSAELQALLGRARKASPPRARLDAVRTRLESELGPLGPPPEPPAESAPPASQTPSWLAPAGAVVVLAVALLAIVARQPAHPASETQGAATPRDHGGVESHESPTEQGVSRDPSPTPPAPTQTPVLVAPSEAPERAPVRERAPHTTERAPGEGTSDEVAPSDPPTDEATRASQLREEIAILERAMSHRRAGDLEAARAALAEHARRFPHGLMAPERERLASELE